MRKLRCLPLAIVAFVLMAAAVGCGAAATPVPAATESAPGGAVSGAVSRGEVLQSLTARVILPGYAAAAAGLAQWGESLDALCAGSGAAGLEAAREGWRAARQGWLRTESYRFGPAMERRSASLVDWWPVDADKIDGHPAGGGAVTVERVRQYLPATQRGLGAAEYLLFGPGSDGLADGAGAALRCEYLRSVASVAGEEVDGILADWQERYAGFYDGTGSSSLLDREAEAVAVRSLVFQVRAIANMRLAPALGLDGEADASAIPAGAAGNSRQDLLSQLDGIAGLYRGADGGLGLSHRVRILSPETDARMLEAIESAITAVGDIGGGIIEQLVAEPGQVMAAYDRIKALQRILNTEIVSLLGVSVGFADTDGDS